MLTGLKQLVAPVNPVVTVDLAKNHERISTDADDALIEFMITACTQKAEAYTRRSFITQTWAYTTNEICQVMELPCPPLVSNDPADYEIITIANDGTETVVDDTTYIVDNIMEPGLIKFPETIPLVTDIVSFPFSVPVYNFPVIKITYLAGYGENDVDVPIEIREAVLQMFGHMYENRESQMIPPYARELLDPYRIEYL